MAINVTDTTFSTTYKDDYADSDNYHRILFNAGRALQAREVTQLQTIIQNEIRRFGNNIFFEGSLVNSGGIVLNNAYEYVKLNTGAGGVALPTDTSSIIGATYTASNGVSFKVLELVAAAGSDPATLYVSYIDTQNGTSGSTPIRVGDANTLTGSGAAPNLVAASSAASGRGTKVSVNLGDYYTRGHFVFVEKQSVFVDKYSSTPTKDIGFKILEQVITPADNSALYDNQGAVPNVASPGADRYQIKLILTTRDQVNEYSDENFVYVGRVVNGNLVDEVKSTDNYNVINDVMAIRTKEESGDYVVKPFIASVKNPATEQDYFLMNVSAGVAYVDGYRLNIPQTQIRVPKARDTAPAELDNLVAEFGSYVTGNPSNNFGFADVGIFEEVNLYASGSATGTILGTANIRYIERDRGEFRFYLFNIQMNPGNSFTQVQSFGVNGDNYVNLTGAQAPQETENNSLIFPLPKQSPVENSVSVVSMTIQKQYAFNPGTDITPYTLPVGQSTVGNALPSGSNFVEDNQWIIAQADGTIDAGDSDISFNLIDNGTSAEISGLTANTDYKLIAYVDIGSSQQFLSPKTKTLQSDTVLTKAWPGDVDSDGSGTLWLSLDKADIYQVKEIRLTNASGASIINNFIVDDGQRDNYYGIGRIILKPGLTVPTGNVYIKYDYFTHGTGGNFFSVSSYTNVAYANIPSYQKTNGEVVSLRDVIDMRPVRNLNGTYNVLDLPQNSSAITVNAEYYYPRRDRLVVTSNNIKGRRGNGEIKVITGISSYTPTLPPVPASSIVLYDISVPAYTFSANDVRLQFKPNKRYTMKDLAALEKRVDNIFNSVILSSVEEETNSLIIRDSDGVDRIKAGYIVDDFSSFKKSDTQSTDFRSKISVLEKKLTPRTYVNSIRLLFDSDTTAGSIVRKGDLLLLPHTDQSFINQTIATGKAQVNPFGISQKIGSMTLSPASDDWIDTEVLPELLFDPSTEKTLLTDAQWSQFNSWVVEGWTGYERRLGNYNVSFGSVSEIIDDKVVHTAAVGTMRPQRIYFKVDGLQPNTKHFVFFNNVNMTSWSKAETSFVRYSDTTENDYRKYRNATSSPFGTSDLVSDANGSLIGSFFIPSNANISFETGTGILKVSDINVPDEFAAASFAKAIYTSAGVINTVERTYKSIRSSEYVPPINESHEGGGGGDDRVNNSGSWSAVTGGGGFVKAGDGFAWSGDPQAKAHANADLGGENDKGDDKIICTAMNQTYGFGSFRQSVWLSQSKELSEEYQLGYHFLFLPLVHYGYHTDNFGSGTVRKILEYGVRHRTADIWKQRHGKRDTIGYGYRVIYDNMCYSIGWLIKKLRRKEDK